MTTVPPVNAAGNPSSTGNTNNTDNADSGSAAAAAASASLNYNDFLQLLIAQMKNQDPTSPMDASQQISQLASFSQVEQQIQTNSHLETVLQNQWISQASSYIGKEITSADGTTSGTVKEVDVYSDGVIAITDAGDKVLIQAGVKVAAPGTTPDVSGTQGADPATNNGGDGTDGGDGADGPDTGNDTGS